MPSRPTDETFASIVSAITAIGADSRAPRTKAHLMRLAGIAHPTVHRAFKWDAEHGTPFKINERWEEITGGSSSRRSPQQAERAELADQLKDARQEISLLRKQLNAAQLVAVSAWLRTQSHDESPTPIGSRRRPLSPKTP